MARFYVGQRVKKVRGKANIGVTGIVVGFDVGILAALDGYDVVVQVTSPAVGTKRGPCPAGTIGATRALDWDPIQPDGHKACDTDFKLDLDRLLEREGVSA